MVPLAECLSADSEVHALDLPGFGRSSGPVVTPSIPELADYVAEWMAAAGVKKCHLFGNSLGSQIVADLAARRPDLLVSLTLTGPTIDPSAHSMPQQAAGILRDMFHEPPRLWVNHLVDDLRCGPIRWVTLLREMFVDHIEKKLPSIPVPTLILRGEHDPSAPDRWCREAAAMIPDARCSTVPDSWHCAHFTHPAEVAAHLRSFIDEAIVQESPSPEVASGANRAGIFP
jgi:pimeloyl-ACP methyl ester carboxylesterase